MDACHAEALRRRVERWTLSVSAGEINNVPKPATFTESVLDLNRLLLFIAVLSPLVVLARTARRAALNRGWQVAAAIVLVVTALAWTAVPPCAGWIGGGAWLALLFLPAVGLRKAADLVAEERYTNARRIVAPLRWLHPVKALRDELLFLRAMEAAQKGATDLALELLQDLHAAESRAGLQAAAQRFRIRGDWLGLLAWSRQNLPLVALGREPALLPLYFRALGETGAIDDMVLQVAGRAPALLASPQHQATFDSSVLMMLAFTGRTDSLLFLLKTRFRGLHADAKEFWIATSQLAAGETEAGRARLESLRQKTANALIRADCAQRLSGEQPLHTSISPTTEITVRRFEKNLSTERATLLSPQSGRLTLAVTIFIALSAAMFVLEIALGGTTNPYTLHRLGALEPFAVLARDEYWRLIAALFLHYGAPHLLVNLYALYVLGPPLERMIGSARFAVCYLAAGLGSSAGVVGLWRLDWTQSDLLVGASGAVMGVVGAWAGLLLRHHHLPMARRRLLSLGLIVVLQTVVDFFTPQVSMAAHLCGLASGFVLGLLIAPREREEGL